MTTQYYRQKKNHCSVSAVSAKYCNISKVLLSWSLNSRYKVNSAGWHGGAEISTVGSTARSSWVGCRCVEFVCPPPRLFLPSYTHRLIGDHKLPIGVSVSVLFVCLWQPYDEVMTYRVYPASPSDCWERLQPHPATLCRVHEGLCGAELVVVPCHMIQNEVCSFYVILFLSCCVSDDSVMSHRRSSSFFCIISREFRAVCLIAASHREAVDHSSGERLNLHPLLLQRLLDVQGASSLCGEIKLFFFFWNYPLRQRESFNFLLSLTSMWCCRQLAIKQLLLQKNGQ